MTNIDLTQMTKHDVYVAAQDLALRLERQIAINEKLRAEVVQLASAPCFYCSVIEPELNHIMAGQKGA
jgi:hypothetical protein